MHQSLHHLIVDPRIWSNEIRISYSYFIVARVGRFLLEYLLVSRRALNYFSMASDVDVWNGTDRSFPLFPIVRKLRSTKSISFTLNVQTSEARNPMSSNKRNKGAVLSSERETFLNWEMESKECFAQHLRILYPIFADRNRRNEGSSQEDLSGSRPGGSGNIILRLWQMQLV